METAARRALLPTRPNPGGRLDCIVTVDGRLPTTGTGVTLRYVPDRLVLDAAAFAGYLAALDPPPGIEELAATVLADVNDVLVPRWLHIATATPDGGHRAAIEDCQPRWNNAMLLQRLERI